MAAVQHKSQGGKTVRLGINLAKVLGQNYFLRYLLHFQCILPWSLLTNCFPWQSTLFQVLQTNVFPVLSILIASDYLRLSTLVSHDNTHTNQHNAKIPFVH